MLALAGAAVIALIGLGVLAGVRSRGGSSAAAAVGAAGVPIAGAPALAWSEPAALAGCPADGPASVVFPDDSPSHGTGAGALVWEAAASCPGGAGARVAPIGAGDLPAAGTVPRDAGARPFDLAGPLLASGAPHGQILIAGSSPKDAHAGVLLQGPAAGPFAPVSFAEAQSVPLALASAYLGDVALAAPQLGGASRLQVHVERFYARAFERSTTTSSTGGGPIQSATLALDYRSEALAVWLQDGTLYAQLLPATGPPARTQRLAHVGPGAVISALLSDDGRGIVAWAQQSGDQTSVWLDRSSNGVRFHAPEEIERFDDPAGLRSPPASPRLVRMSSEGVLLAWAGESGGRWVVRSAPLDMNGMGEVSTIEAPGSQALLAGLVPGPRDEALALWTVPASAAGASGAAAGRALFAARAFEAPPQRTQFAAAEELAAPGPVGQLAAGIDPDSGRALVVWQAQGGVLEYSVREAPGG